MTQSALSRALLSTLTGLAACTVAPDIEFRDTNGPPLGGCPPEGCPPNSPRVNDFPLPELSVDYQFNNYGDNALRVIGLRDPIGTLYKLDISGDELVAKDGGGNFVSAGQGLVDWHIELETTTGEVVRVQVRGYTNTGLSMANFPYTLSAYALAYEDPTDPDRFLNVCPEALYDPDATVVTAIGSETYDAEHIAVNPGMTGWFTLACSQEAAYKMKMMGYSPNIALGGIAPSTWQQRQATLKMITADYCGDGESHTVQNTEVNWYNNGGTVGTPVAALPIEAFWDHEGALCLTTQRRPELTVDCDVPLPDCLTTPVFSYEWTTRVPLVEEETSTGP